jgi:RNA polymerase sigma factor (sigma-70 family)
MSCSDDGLAAFLTVRSRLFSIAYRMLHSAAEAEDIVQDVWVRWQTADRALVRDAAAFLATTTTRMAINVMQSARCRRETYAADSLPEPVDAAAGAPSAAEQAQALARGVHLLVQTLTPTERFAFILREAFDYPYRDIANVLRLGEANARQVVTRARRRVANGRTLRANQRERGVTTRASIRSCLVDAARSHHRNEREANHEIRNHRRHWPHRIEARDEAQGARS